MSSNDRVKICYTVLQDEVPDELSRFFEKALEVNNKYRNRLRSIIVIPHHFVDIEKLYH